MRYSENIDFKHSYFPLVYDRLAECYETFKADYTAMSQEQRFRCITDVNKNGNLKIESKTDTAITIPTELDIGRIFWEMVKTDIMRNVLCTELPQFIIKNIERSGMAKLTEKGKEEISFKLDRLYCSDVMQNYYYSLGFFDFYCRHHGNAEMLLKRKDQ